jgi:hypothetical protein
VLNSMWIFGKSVKHSRQSEPPGLIQLSKVVMKKKNNNNMIHLAPRVAEKIKFRGV